MVVRSEPAARVREIGPEERDRWEAFVTSAPNGHLLQSWTWGEFKRRHGWRPVRLAIVRDARFLAAAQILYRSIGGLSLAYVPRGPVVPANRPDLYGQLLAAIHSRSRWRRSIFLKVEPNEPRGSELDNWLCRQGFTPSPHTAQPRATLTLHLHGGENAVFARLPKKTRYQIRLAERRGLQVRSASDDADVQRFHALLVTTGERATFPVRSARYYQDVYRAFQVQGQAALFLAELDGQAIGGVMAFAYGPEGIYMYAASSNEHKDASPNDLLQWRAIQWCIGRGCTRYDLWGIPERAAHSPGGEGNVDPGGDVGGLWGVYRFKRRFADQPVRYAGAYDYAYLPPLYNLWARLRRNSEL